ncbi:MAG: InlB B-repeat-containing protein [Clostridia bacterium]|nr:InlB B-repeat-containing protein [Clostridia bacterium]
MILRQKNIRRALLCVLLVTVMTVGMLVGAVLSASAAEIAGPYDLTVNFDKATASYCIGTGEYTPTSITSGVAIEDIPNGKHVVIRITPIDGYTLDTATCNSASIFVGSPAIDGATGKPYFEITIPSMASNYTYDVTCKERTFEVELKPSAFASAGATSIDYSVEGIDGNLSLTHKITPSIVLPNPAKPGYTFKRWEVRGAANEVYVLSNNELPNTMLNSVAIKTGVISVYPVFEPNKYKVTRYDYAFDLNAQDYRGETLGSFSWMAPMASIIYGQTATSAGDPAADGYVGYRLCTELDTDVINAIRSYISVTIAPTVNDAYGIPHRNDVSRYYLPEVYKLSYTYNGGNAIVGAVDQHTFNQTTELPTPTRKGYTFMGWLVTVDGKTVGTAPVTSLVGKTVGYAVTNEEDQTIYLSAQWKPITYDIEYDLDGGAFEGIDPAKKHTFDTPTPIPVPLKTGYNFKGWYINGLSEATNFADGKLPAQTISAGGTTITLKAKWVPKTFTVALDGNVGDTGDTVKFLETSLDGFFTFGQTYTGILSEAPERTGYTFKGFYTAITGGERYIDENGHGTEVEWLLDDEDNDGIVTLYARWEANPYDIRLEYDSDLVVSVTVGGKVYNLENFPEGIITVRYREPIEVIIVAIDGHKVVSWDGRDEAHANRFVKSYRHETASDILDLRIEILPALTAPSVKVDFATETVVSSDGNALREGVYAFFVDGAFWCEAEVGSSGAIYINGTRVESVKLIEECFGKELQVVARGRRGVTADSDPLTIAIPARPAAPELQYSVTLGQDKILLSILSGNAEQYQYSISQNSAAPSSVWLDTPEFSRLADGSALTPGTTYYVFVRVKSTATTPASLPILPPLSFRTEPVTDEIGLVVPMICLGITLLCQLVAIVLLLIRRQKSKKEQTLYGMAPISMLAVRFLPAEGLPVVLVLAALVVIAQAVLIYLLVTSDLVRRPKREKKKDEVKETEKPMIPTEAEERDAMHVFDEPEEGEDEPVLTTLTDADLSPSGMGDDYHLTYESAETEPMDEEVQDELFAEFDEEAEENADEKFIEPAPAAQYSLPDEDAPAFEYDEEVEEEEAEEEAEEIAQIDPDADIDDSLLEEVEQTYDEDELPDIDDSKNYE